ncbi:LysR family transcriptional regulator [Celerinatantimonas diazotrophica]|uniref:Transcriptional regulator n=1 Tax=Celerinatantimonas diazotrophica TaxID=412034 RepID=A0A4V2PRG4_9GAMM|nr:LysR family transcriptional regulator [Celerinatantimonas diazotrophica]TCK58711.1 transcriptional regulator [Celerinatantimonas diazotrophica]CAG9297340.1 HTH-type transcriptional regulator DmlR [Celerinatantimonas diazotrophica]
MNTNEIISLLPEMAIFVHVVESQSFTKTATELGVSPSSISRSVSRLESALELKLLERTTRNMRVTNKGNEIYQVCNNIMAAANCVSSMAKSDDSKVRGQLRVAAPKALSRQILTPIILDFMVQYPEVELQLKVTDNYVDVIRDDIDLLVHITEHPIESLVGRIFTECKLIMCATPKYLDNRGVPLHPNDLSNHNCLCLGEEPKDRYWKFTLNDQICSVHVQGTLHVNHSEIRREAVLRGIGISVFPEFSIREYVESGEVIELFDNWHIEGNYQGKLIAQYPQSKYIPAQLKKFVEFLSQRINKDSN